MKTRNLLWCILMGSLLAAPGARAETNAPAPAADADVLAPLRNEQYLFEVSKHLYRWYLDESDVDKAPPSGSIEFWIRRLNPPLDTGDRSIMAELLIPLCRISATLKKTDYAIDELNVRVQSRSFKITHVARPDVLPASTDGWEVVNVDMPRMREYLFQTRNQRDFPDPQLSARMQNALFEQMDDFPDALNQPEQIVHWSPLSPVANEVWVFWENARMLVHFESDIDLSNPAVWDHDELSARTYDIDKQMVVSLSETPGSNRFLTRDQVGRILYNCIILGEKRVSTADRMKAELEESKKQAAADSDTNAPAPAVPGP